MLILSLSHTISYFNLDSPRCPGSLAPGSNENIILYTISGASSILSDILHVCHVNTTRNVRGLKLGKYGYY